MTTRDMTRREYLAALRRNGLRETPLGFWVKHDEFPNISWGVTLRVSGRHTHHRATLANVLRKIRQERAKANG